jgi:catechol 2,3-dioxygenase-like lactoylglutathione lyase family enzyme
LEAVHDSPGTNDICLLTKTPIAEVRAHLDGHDVPIVEGPVERPGATSPLLSMYLRDPDGNLIEIARPIPVGEDDT